MFLNLFFKPIFLFLFFLSFFSFSWEWVSISPHSLKFLRSLCLRYLCLPSSAQGISGLCAFRPLIHLPHHRIPRPALSRIDRGSRLPSSLPCGWPRPSGQGAARPSPHPPQPVDTAPFESAVQNRVSRPPQIRFKRDNRFKKYLGGWRLSFFSQKKRSKPSKLLVE